MVCIYDISHLQSVHMACHSLRIQLQYYCRVLASNTLEIQEHPESHIRGYQLAESRRWALRLAADAATTVLKVDQIIMAKVAGGPKPRAPGPMDED